MQIENNSIPSRMGVVIRNVVPMFAKPDASSERVTQGLLGQTVTEEGGQGDWLFVQMWDSYRAWVHVDSIRMLDHNASPYASTGPIALVRELFVDVFKQPNERSEVMTKATISNELEVVRVHDEWVELKLPNKRIGFIKKAHSRLIEKDLVQTMWLPESRKLVETAMRFVGVPYLWGGTSPFGLDCSGFVQLVHHIHNVTLLRDAHMQASDVRGEPVRRNELMASDLVFFGKPNEYGEERITHVGMMIDKEQFIHSCGNHGVIITSIDEPNYRDIYCRAIRMRLDTLDPGGGAPKE